jgi:hypothetical protein
MNSADEVWILTSNNEKALQVTSFGLYQTKFGMGLEDILCYQFILLVS